MRAEVSVARIVFCFLKSKIYIKHIKLVVGKLEQTQTQKTLYVDVVCRPCEEKKHDKIFSICRCVYVIMLLL